MPMKDEKFPASVSQAFLQACQKQLDSPFLLRHDGQTIHCWTYADMLCGIYATIEFLRSQDLKRGDRVLCYLSRNETILEVFLASSFLGAIPLPVSMVYSHRYCNFTAERSQARIILTTKDHVPGLNEATTTKIVSYENFTPRSAHVTTDTSDILSQLEEMAAKISSEDPFMIQPTSGSTGVPKLVLRKHLAFLRYAQNLQMQIENADHQGRHRILMAAALTHAFAWHLTTTALCLDAEIAIPSTLDLNARLQEIHDLDPSVFPLVPRVARSFYQQYIGQKNRFKKALGSNAKIVVSAGGTADEDTMNFYRHNGLKILEMYGSSEASMVALTPYDQWRPQHAGPPVQDVQLKFGPDKEILVKSPGLMIEYFNDPEITKQAIDSEGYYHTGDLGELSPEGYLKILGRKKDLFNTPDGDNIYPERIEIAIESKRWIGQVMLIGDRKPYITAIISLRDHVRATIDDYVDDLIKMHALKLDSFPEIYERALAEVLRLNEKLEEVEKVKKVILINGSLPVRIYHRVGSAKVRRNRKALLKYYAEEIDLLYSSFAEFEVKNLLARFDHQIIKEAA